MSEPFDSYASGLLAKFNSYAAWPPNAKLRLGDIGVLADKVFGYKGNLAMMGIRFGSQVSEPIDLDHSSGCSMDMSTGLSGQARVPNSPGYTAVARIGLTSSGSFVFQATGCREHEVTNKLKLAELL